MLPNSPSILQGRMHQPFQPHLSRNHMAPQGPNCPFGFRTNNYSLYILVQIISDIYELGFTKPEYMKYDLFHLKHTYYL